MNDDRLSSKWIPAIVNGASSPMEVAECTGCSDHWSTHDTKKKTQNFWKGKISS